MPRLERDGDSGREHRVEERAGVAGEQPAVAGVGGASCRRSPSRRAPATPVRAARSSSRTAGVSRDGGVASRRGRPARAGGRADRGSTTPTLVSSSSIGISQNQPASLARDDADVAGALARGPRDAGEVRVERDVGSRGSARRRPSLRARSPARPVASTRAAARSPGGRRGRGHLRARRRRPRTRHVVDAVALQRTSTPPRGARSSSMASSARGTCKVCGGRISGEVAKSTGRPRPRRGSRGWLPTSSGSLAARTCSATPRASRPVVDVARSDSPMWKRGKRSRSTRTTQRPRWARAIAAGAPAGPPPATATS